MDGTNKTRKQLKRDFKKYLTTSEIEFIANTSNIQISKFIISFDDDGYCHVWTPHKAKGIYHMAFPYFDAHTLFCKILRYHMLLHGHGLHIKGRVRTLKDGKTRQYFQ